MSQKYKALRILIWFYRILGILAIMGGVLALVASIVIEDSEITSGIAALIGGLVGAVVLIGMGELFQLLVDVEENTRATTAALRQLKPQGRDRT